MSPVRRRVTIRPSRGRLVLWSVCLVVIAVLVALLWRDRGAGGSAAAPVPGRSTAVDARPRPTGPPAVRFAALGRAAHLIVLSGLEMNLYTIAAVEDGWVDVRIHDRAAEIVAGLAGGELDVACLPLRDAVRMFGEDPEAAPRIIAGAARGDEQYVVHANVRAIAEIPLAPLRIGLLEPPRLDLRRALELDAGGDAPAILLVAPGSLAPSLANGELDLAVLPEPLASQTAALSGSRVEPQAELGDRRILGGAVLVARRPFLTEHRALVVRLVQSHALSAHVVTNDLGTAVQRAAALLDRAQGAATPEPVWTAALAHVELGIEPPLADLGMLLDLARERQEAPAGAELGALVAADVLAEARTALAEATRDD